jgi:2-phospho-L-lactate/phosphoenolpyruvate guanylyltransferase
MTAEPVWAVVPVKPFEVAKLRLAPVLSKLERICLARAMLEDVLDAIGAGRRIAGLIVVTRDADAAAMARQRGAIVFAEESGVRLNGALNLAVRHLAGIGGSGMIILPADIPHVTARTLDGVAVLLGRPPAVVLAEAISDGGTNIFACRPADAVASSFGPDSFHRHLRAALRAGIAPRVIAHENVGRDLDRPEDLTAFLAVRSPTRTHALLSQLEIDRRLRFAVRTRHAGRVPTRAGATR